MRDQDVFGSIVCRTSHQRAILRNSWRPSSLHDIKQHTFRRLYVMMVIVTIYGEMGSWIRGAHRGKTRGGGAQHC